MSRWAVLQPDGTSRALEGAFCRTPNPPCMLYQLVPLELYIYFYSFLLNFRNPFLGEPIHAGEESGQITEDPDTA